MDISYQAQQVKQYDHDHYVCCLFTSQKKQEKLFSILAFYLEIELISHNGAELLPSLMKITWWQEAIDKLYLLEQQSHPLLKPLSEVVVNSNIPKNLFDDIFQLRIIEIYDEVPQDIDGLTKFAQDLGFNLLKIMSLVLGIENINYLKNLGTALELLKILKKCRYDHALTQIIIERIEEELFKIDQKSFSKESAPIDLLFFLINLYIKLIKSEKYNLLSNKIYILPLRKQLCLTYQYLIKL